jgi:4-carboxymuconolactone decarboxylase
MKPLTIVVLWMMMIFAFIARYGSRVTFAQSSSGVAQSSQKLPPDIRPDTLSRMPRTKREDLTTDEARQAFDRVMVLSPKQKVSRWLGETGTRLQVPELALVYQEQIGMLHEKGGLEPKYAWLAILVATRETDDESGFLTHAPDAIKQGIDPKVVEIVRTRSDTKGLEAKQAAIIQFGRELFQQPIVSSKTFAEAERQLGRKGTLGMTLFMCYYMANRMLMRAYDQHLDTSPGCVDPHNGCASAKGHLW